MRCSSHIFLSAFFGLLICAEAWAQKGNRVDVVVLGDEGGEPLEFATVSLRNHDFKKAAPFFSLSDKSGKASFTSLKEGKWVLKAELLGYLPDSLIIDVEKTGYSLDTLRLRVNAEFIDAATVSAKGNGILIKKDTVEYNAGAYLTMEGDLLEDLLKKLPGVEIGENGAITVNGETVKKITIDGKTFFLNDPTVASRNIPAKLVKKLKVIEKKSDQAEFTGIDDGERETVIDLTVDEKAMKGSFGTVTGGLGSDIRESGEGDSDLRYLGEAFVGRIRKNDQLVGLLNANNTNNRGSTDMSARMMRSSSSSNSSDDGVNSVLMTGLNGNWTLFGGKMNLGANYVFNNTDNLVSRDVSRVSHLAKRDINYTSQSSNDTRTYGNTFGSRLEHKFSKSTSLIFEPQISFGHGRFDDASSYSTDSDRNGIVRHTNEGWQLNSGKNRNFSTEGTLLLRQRLGLPGRTLTLYGRYNYKHSTTDALNQSLTRSFDSSGDPVDSLLNQTVDRNSDNISFTLRATYTEPIGRGFYVEGNYAFTWGNNSSYRDTYDDGEVYNILYSNNIHNRYINQRAGANLLFQKGKTRAQAGLSANPTSTRNETMRRGVENSYDSDVVNWAPNASFSAEFSKRSSIRMTYYGRSSQPTASQLMPSPNVSNRLHVTMGNPYLLPYFSNSLNTVFRYGNRQTFTSFFVRLRANMVKDPIVNALWYASDGVQYSMPVNGPASWNASLSSTYNSPIARSDFSVNNYLAASMGRSSSYVGSDVDMTPYYDSDGEFDYEKFHSENKNVSSSRGFDENVTRTSGFTEQLILSYRSDNLEIRSSGRTRFSRASYSLRDTVNRTWNNQVGASVTWRWKKTGLSFDTQLQFRWYNGYSSPRDDEYIWNARIRKSLLSGRLSVGVRASDILNQSKALTVTDSGNSHREVLSNTLGRYWMATAVWNFGRRSGKRSGFQGYR